MIELIAALILGEPALDHHEASAVTVEATEPIAAAEFLVGRWAGTGMGGEVQESWSPAIGGQMVGHFTYSREGQPVFYEILLIRPDETGGLEMLVKHFNADFTAWEDKEEWVRFGAKSHGAGRIDFRGLTLVKEGETLTATVTMRQGDGSVNDVPFVMTRAD